MSDFELFCKIIADDAKITLSSHYDNKKVTLIEPEHPELSLDINNVPNDTLVIKCDALKIGSGSREQNSSSFFNKRSIEVEGTEKSESVLKRADYAIIFEKNNKINIFIIELKKSSKTQWHIEHQLIGAKCIMEYCKAIGREFYGKTDFLEHTDYKFITFTETGSVGMKKPEKGNIIKAKNKTLKEYYNHRATTKIQFNRLISG